MLMVSELIINGQESKQRLDGPTNNISETLHNIIIQLNTIQKENANLTARLVQIERENQGLKANQSALKVACATSCNAPSNFSESVEGIKVLQRAMTTVVSSLQTEQVLNKLLISGLQQNLSKVETTLGSRLTTLDSRLKTGLNVQSKLLNRHLFPFFQDFIFFVAYSYSYIHVYLSFCFHFINMKTTLCP